MAPDQTDPNAACAPSSQFSFKVLRRSLESAQYAASQYRDILQAAAITHQ